MYFVDPTFDLFSIMFFIVFCIVIGSFVVSAVKGVNEWSSNNKQPILDVKCIIISKRSETIRHAGHTSANGMHHSGGSSTSYYVTFEFESKDRMEFSVSGKEFGLIAEGDIGMLKFQGSRFLEFNRI